MKMVWENESRVVGWCEDGCQEVCKEIVGEGRKAEQIIRGEKVESGFMHPSMLRLERDVL